VRSFLTDVLSVDVRREKARLQTILATATVYRDGTIELAFRSQAEFPATNSAILLLLE
jgi:hypothetical protein